MLKEYEKVAQMKGDPSKGATLFQQNCTTCHRFKGQGTDLAPELGMVANKSVEALLVAIHRHHTRACVEEAGGQRCAERACAAGDDDAAAVEAEPVRHAPGGCRAASAR